jgi:hypothetical protein
MFMAYSDRKKAETLAILDSNGGNLLRTSKETGVPLATLHGWKSNPSEDVSELRNKNGIALADECEEIAWIYGSHLKDPDVIAKAPAQAASTVMGTMIDKMRLLREQSTQNVGVIVSQKEQAMDFILECFRQGKTKEQVLAALDYFEQVDRSVREDAKLVLGEGLSVPEKIIENNEEKS